MKKFLIIAIVIMILAAAFQATKIVSAEQGNGGVILAATGGNLELQDMVIRKNGNSDEVNFRVRVKNIGTTDADNLKKNLVVYLRVKNTRTGNWDLLQEWSNINQIKAGNTVARDRLVKSYNVDIISNKFTLQAEIVLKNPGNTIISKKIIEGNYPLNSVKNP